MKRMAVIWGLAAAALFLVVYFYIVSLISGWGFALDQFSRYWYFLVGLAAGFGMQVGLYAYLRGIVRAGASRGMVAVSGTTSTVAMLSCCAHYLANILPILGVTGVISLIGQYQIELFWVGLFFNAGGVVYIANKIIKIRKA